MHEGFESTSGEAGVVDDRKLVVLGLPWVTDEASLRKYFSQFGPLQARRAASRQSWVSVERLLWTPAVIAAVMRRSSSSCYQTEACTAALLLVRHVAFVMVSLCAPVGSC